MATAMEEKAILLHQVVDIPIKYVGTTFKLKRDHSGYFLFFNGWKYVNREDFKIIEVEVYYDDTDGIDYK